MPRKGGNAKVSREEKEKRGTVRTRDQVRLKQSVLDEYPAPIKDLGPDETRIYNLLCGHLQKVKNLYTVDVAILTAAAINIQMMMHSIEGLQNEGAVQYFENGTRNVSPEFTVFIKSNELFLKHSRQLGLDPRSRQEILAFVENTAPDDDPISALLAG